MKKLADAIRTGVEIMGREIRLAKKDGTGCTAGGQSFEIIGVGTGIKFIDFDGRCIEYNFTSPTLTKSIAGLAPKTFLGGDITVSSVTFSLITGPNQQPRVVITGSVQTLDPTSSNQTLDLSIQTTLSQRELQVL